MLDDYTFFGEIDQNRANDLRFTIDLTHGAIEETESLHAIMVEEERKDRYNLMGQKVNENAQGFLLQNGRKIFLSNRH